MSFDIDSSVRIILRPWIGAALAAVAWTGSALGADNSTPNNEAGTDNTTLAEVVVTAQFRVQKLQDTPIAILAKDDPLGVVKRVRELAILRRDHRSATVPAPARYQAIDAMKAPGFR